MTKDNGGVSSARNYGVDNSMGEYISFVDSDDVVSPDYLSRAYTFLVKSGADFVIGELCGILNLNEVDNFKLDGTDKYDIYEYEKISKLKKMFIGK